MSHRSLLTLSTVFLLVALAAPVRADVTTTNIDATKCWSDAKDMESFLQRTAAAGGNPAKIKNISTQNRQIHCPLVKTTSGPGITNDALVFVDVPVQTTSPNLVTCFVHVWDTTILDGTDSNRVWYAGSSTQTSKTMRIQPFDYTVTGYWDKAGSAGNPTSWFYLDLTCELPPQSSITSYSFREAGVDQPGYRIYSHLACAPDSTSNVRWRNIPELGVDDSHGGFNMGQSVAGATKYAMKCPLLPNAIARFAVGSGGTTNQMGCNLNTNNFSSFTWTTSTVREYPPEILRQYGQPMIVGPVSTGTADNLFCGVNTGSGDAKVLSYRTRPQPSRSSWVTSASAGGSTGNVKDNNGGTRWTTGTSGANGQWFKVDFGSAKSFNQITMDAGSSTDDFARGYRVEVSNDNTNWTTVKTATGTSKFISTVFNEQSARYLRIVLTNGFSSWWSIHELNVYSIWEWL